jgi:predicted glycoside hydrolase/deacetylase ChbG (UPF0249 family)
MTARIHLITRGDDLGTNHSANAAIREAFESGILRNASLMAPCAAVEEAAEMLAGEAGLCIGLHPTMNAEWDSVRWGPVLPAESVPSLVDDRGHFFQTVRALAERGPDVDEVFAELQAQLDRARALGFDVRYVDQHMAWSRAVEGMEERFERWCERTGILPHYRCHRALPRAGSEEGDRVEQVIAALEAAEPGQYALVGHPAYDDDEMRALGHKGYPGEQVALGRRWERLMFMDPRMVQYCRENGVVPIRYDEADRLR